MRERIESMKSQECRDVCKNCPDSIVKGVSSKGMSFQKPLLIEWAAANPEQAAELLNLPHDQQATEGEVLIWEQSDVHIVNKMWSGKKPTLNTTPSAVKKCVLLGDDTLKVQYQTAGNLQELSFKTVCLFFIVLFHCFSQAQDFRTYDVDLELGDNEIAEALMLKPILDGLLAAHYDPMKYPVLRVMFEMITHEQVFADYLDGVVYTARIAGVKLLC